MSAACLSVLPQRGSFDFLQLPAKLFPQGLRAQSALQLRSRRPVTDSVSDGEPVRQQGKVQTDTDRPSFSTVFSSPLVSHKDD